MTALCGGGPSQSKPGFNQTAVITGAVLDSALVVLGLEPLAAALAPFIAGTVYDLTTFCATDPPADPGLTGQDFIDVTNFIDPTVSIPALAKLKQWFESWYWYDVCQCTGGSTPAAPTPSNPGNVVSLNPGLPSNPQPCWNVTQNYATTPSPNSSTFVNADITKLMLPVYGTTKNSTDARWFGNGPVLMQSVPPGAQNLVLTASVQPPLASSALIEPEILWFDVNGNWLNGGISITLSAALGQSGSASFNASLPANAAFWGCQIESRDTVSHVVTMTLQFQCAGGTALSNTPCCPPDPSIDTRLQQIYGLLQSIYQSLPSPIHSYADGTVHSSLTGNGTITLNAAALAVRVDITADTPAGGIEAGNPNYLFDRGFIVPVINSAPVARRSRLVYNPQLFPLPTLTEQIGYSLAPGVTISITELTAGP